MVGCNRRLKDFIYIIWIVLFQVREGWLQLFCLLFYYLLGYFFNPSWRTDECQLGLGKKSIFFLKVIDIHILSIFWNLIWKTVLFSFQSRCFYNEILLSLIKDNRFSFLVVTGTIFLSLVPNSNAICLVFGYVSY